MSRWMTPGAVQRHEAARELRERPPEALDVEHPVVRRRLEGPLAAARAGPHVVEEVVALDELHRQVEAPGVLEELSEPDQKRVGELGEHPKLVLELVERVAGALVESLDGEALAGAAIPCFEDRAHPARPELAQELVAIYAQTLWLHPEALLISWRSTPGRPGSTPERSSSRWLEASEHPNP